MCGMPQRSRVTRTGADNPATATVPHVCAVKGNGACDVVSRHAATASSPHATIACTTTACMTARMTTTRVTAARTTLGCMALKDGLLAEFDHEMGTTRRLLERVPEEKMSWKPHERSMSLGGLATHLSNL